MIFLQLAKCKAFFLNAIILHETNTLTPFVLDSFMSIWHMLESSERREPWLRKFQLNIRV